LESFKTKTKARVKHVAFNLIQLYAKKEMTKGFRFAPDSYLQNELESSFIYEDTPDQTKSTQEVKLIWKRSSNGSLGLVMWVW
jgi:transcription-repair coupling factor (superfamily II helicase)